MAAKKTVKPNPMELDNGKVDTFIKEINAVQVKHGLRLVIRERDSHYIAVEKLPEPKK